MSAKRFGERSRRLMRKGANAARLGLGFAISFTVMAALLIWAHV